VLLLGIVALQPFPAPAASVTLAWDASPDPIQRYVVHYGNGSAAYTATTNAGTALTQTVQGLLEGQTYFFAVTAIGTNSLESDFSNEVTYSVPFPSNAPPTITSIANQTINEDGAAGPLNFTVGDAETAAGSLVVTGASSNPGLVPTAGIVLVGSGASRTVTVTPAANQSGTAQITLTVSDGSATASLSFTVTVNSVNDAPTLAALSNLSVAQDAGLQTVGLSGIGTGAANETQTLTVTAASGNPSVVPNPTVTYSTPNSSGTLQFTPQTQGTAVITVTVQDSGGTANGGVNIAQRTFTVAVTSPLNTAPTLTTIANQTINEDGVAGPLNFTVGDAESPASSLTLTRASSNTSLVPTANVVLGGSGANRTVTVTPVANLSGTAQITLTVSDGTLSATQSFSVVVQSVNDSPTLAALADVTLDEGANQQTVNLTGIGSGATNEAQTLTVTATSSNTGLIPTPTITYTSPNSTGTLRFTPLPLAFGTATLSVSVNDGGTTNSQVIRTFIVTVNPVNNTPTLDALANLTINEGAGQQTVNLTGISSGATNEAQTLTVTANSSNTGLIPTPTVTYTSPGSTGTLRFTPVSAASGTATLTVSVNDGATSSNVVTRTFIVTVNRLPVISPIADQMIVMGTPATPISFTISDAETAAGSLVLSATSANQALVRNADIVFGGTGTSRSVTITPMTNQTGFVEITIAVSDGTGNASSTFGLLVQRRPGAPGSLRIAQALP
jgi:hypothetical protein